MHSETQINLAKHRLETAEEKLEASKLLLAGGLFKDSIGRSYYAIFSATRAVLALDSKDFSKHAGVIACYCQTANYNRVQQQIKIPSDTYQTARSCL